MAVLADEVGAYAAERQFKTATRERWLALAERDAAALLALARDLRLGENQLRDVWNWAEEIALRDGGDLATVLTAPEILTLQRGGLGRNDRLARIKAALRRRRFPALSAAEARAQDLVRRLELPRHIRLIVPEFLDGDAVTVEIEVTGTAALAEAAARLTEIARRAEVAELFDVLAGE